MLLSTVAGISYLAVNDVAEVARALAVGLEGPTYLLLDEPFAGVDPMAVADLQGLIHTLRQQGMGILITDHNVCEP